MVWNPVDKLKDAADAVTPEFVEDAAGAVKDSVTAPFRAVRSAQELIGLPSGNDGGSSNWAAWGHQDICDMLDGSVSVEQTVGWEQDWRDELTGMVEVFDTAVQKLSTALGEGWGGESGARALAAAQQVGQWVPQFAMEGEKALQTLSGSGRVAENAQRNVPRPTGLDLGRALEVGFVSSLRPGGLAAGAAEEIDRAVQAQQAAQEFMATGYSAPIGASDPRVPRAYPELPDPTMQAPDPALAGGGGVGGAGGGGGVPGGFGGGGVPGGAPVVTAAQGVAPSGFQAPAGTPVSPAAAGAGGVPDQSGVGGRAGVPVSPAAFTPGAGAGAGGGRAGGGGGRAGAGFGRGIGGGAAGRADAPRPQAPSGSGSGSAGAAGASRGGAGVGRGMTPMGGAMGGAGRGKDDDWEHKNKFLVEQDEDEVNPIVGKLRPAMPAGGVIGRPPWHPDYQK